MNCGYVVRVENLRPHSNADKLQVLTVFDSDTCVSLDVKVGDLGVYFPSGLQLSEMFCEQNHLCRTKADGTPDTGYMEWDKRNVKTIRLRGEYSDGIYLPISCLEYTGIDVSTLEPGTLITMVNGCPICEKYVPKSKEPQDPIVKSVNKTRKKKVPVAPLFKEHADTEQLAYNLAAFKPGDLIEITLKLHGTSGRTAYVPTLQGYKRTLWDKLTKREGTPIYEYGYVSGTRRTVLDGYDGGFYGSNAFREPHSKFFEGKLQKGEEVYYEIVGFMDGGRPIMGSCATPKNAQKEYGKEMVFSYGCSLNGMGYYLDEEHNQIGIENDKPKSDIYVYRMTLTNEDGFVVEYTPEFMRYRCEQMGVKCVPIMWKGYIPDSWVLPGVPYCPTGDEPEFSAGEWIKKKAEEFYDGPDPIGKTHIREGVVVRIINRPGFKAFKHKNLIFKEATGIAVENVDPNSVDADILAEM